MTSEAASTITVSSSLSNAFGSSFFDACPAELNTSLTLPDYLGNRRILAIDYRVVGTLRTETTLTTDNTTSFDGATGSSICVEASSIYGGDRFQETGGNPASPPLEPGETRSFTDLLDFSLDFNGLPFDPPNELELLDVRIGVIPVDYEPDQNGLTFVSVDHFISGTATALITFVPEPAALVLFGLGAGALLLRRRAA